MKRLKRIIRNLLKRGRGAASPGFARTACALAIVTIILALGAITAQAQSNPPLRMRRYCG